jgi:hypothetical protein
MSQFLVVTIFAILKTFNITAENPTYLMAFRAFFVLVHVFLFVTFVRTNYMIESMVGAKDAKIQSRLNLRKEFGNVLFRGAVISLVHWKTLMMPPLIVSSMFGIFTVMENPDASHVTFKTKRD